MEVCRLPVFLHAMGKNTKNAQGDSVDGRSVDTIEAAAGATGYSERFLSALKGRGCAAFRGSRVYLDELEAYYLENQAECSALEAQCDEVDEIDAELKRERVRKLRIANDQAEGLLISRADQAAAVESLASELKHHLRTQLEETMPRRLVGKSESEIRTAAGQLVDELCAIFNRGTRARQ